MIGELTPEQALDYLLTYIELPGPRGPSVDKAEGIVRRALLQKPKVLGKGNIAVDEQGEAYISVDFGVDCICVYLDDTPPSTPDSKPVLIVEAGEEGE